MKNILIIGRGKTGQSVERFAKLKHISVSFFEDDKDNVENVLKGLNKFDALILSPSVRDDHPLLIAAKALNIKTYTDIDLFLDRVKTPVIGLTGTNGKSTTTALIGHILKDYFKDVFIGGNIGIPVLDLIDLPSKYFVLELSSYQLHLSHPFAFDISILLNITPDHLEYHGSMDAYVRSKTKIFEKAKNAIISIDDPYSLKIFETLKSPNIITISTKQKADFYLSENSLYHHNEYLLSLEGLYLKGEHNAQNILASLAVCNLLKVPLQNTIESIKAFKGLSHRLQNVRKIHDIIFINDSKGTNADATEKAILSYIDEEIYWILGGLSKTEGIDPLQKYFKGIKKAYTIGNAADRFHDTLIPYGVDTEKSMTLEKAVLSAFNDAKHSKSLKKKVILFSPASASQDQFKNFEHRGDVFCEIVNALDEI